MGEFDHSRAITLRARTFSSVAVIVHRTIYTVVIIFKGEEVVSTTGADFVFSFSHKLIASLVFLVKVVSNYNGHYCGGNYSFVFFKFLEHNYSFFK
jgi:hypothetical protein